MNLSDAVREGFIALISSPMHTGQAVAEAVKRRKGGSFKPGLQGIFFEFEFKFQK